MSGRSVDDRRLRGQRWVRGLVCAAAAVGLVLTVLAGVRAVRADAALDARRVCSADTTGPCVTIERGLLAEDTYSKSLNARWVLSPFEGDSRHFSLGPSASRQVEAGDFLAGLAYGGHVVAVVDEGGTVVRTLGVGARGAAWSWGWSLLALAIGLASGWGGRRGALWVRGGAGVVVAGALVSGGLMAVGAAWWVGVVVGALVAVVLSAVLLRVRSPQAEATAF